MDLIYEMFLCSEYVVNIKTNEEYIAFCEICKSLNLRNIKHLSQISFEDLHKENGFQIIEYGNICIQFQLKEGFIFGLKNIIIIVVSI